MTVSDAVATGRPAIDRPSSRTAVRRGPSPFRRGDGFGRALPFLAVGLLLYGTFVVYPLLRSVALSFVGWKGYGEQTWVGLANYVELFTSDPVFGTALRNTVLWTVLSILVPNAIGLGLAVALNGRIRGRVALRTAFYAPAVLATVVVAMTWNYFYEPTVGLFNATLSGVGLEQLIRPWLGDPSYAFFAVFATSVWQSTGISMILLLAGLQTVSKDLVEAAALDGAGRWNVFRHVELPALRPTLAIVAVLSVIHALKAFDIVYAMTQGGPGDSSQVLASLAWSKALIEHDYGGGAATSVVLLVLSVGALIPYLRFAFRDLA